jgi:hypothetical protein
VSKTLIVNETAGAYEQAIEHYRQFAYDAKSRRGIGVIQPQSGLNYPFVAPSNDIEYLLADFYLSYDDEHYYNPVKTHIEHPLRIKYLYGFGCVENEQPGNFPEPKNVADIVIVDANNHVVLDTTAPDIAVICAVKDNNIVYTTVEWQTKTAVCRVIAYKKWPNDDNGVTDDDTEREYNIYLTPKNAILDERTIEKVPKHVRAMRVQNGDCVTPWFKEKVSLVNGHNTELVMGDTATENLRRTTSITFSAVAGSGAGQYGLCATGICVEDTPTNVCPPGKDPVIDICTPVVGEEIKAINGAKPDDAGNIFLTASDCLWVRKPAAYTAGVPHNYANVNNERKRSVMAVGADCAPCCACADYLESAKYMTNLGVYYRDIGNRVTEIKLIHEDNINRWDQQRECRDRRPLELLLIQQPCPCMDVVLFYCNHCETCAENVVLTVNFTSTPAPAGAALDVKYTKMVADNRSNAATVSGGWPVFSVKFPTVAAGASVYSQFRLCFCPQYPYAIKGTLTGIKRGGAILAGCGPTAPPASIEASQILDCTTPIIVMP